MRPISIWIPGTPAPQPRPRLGKSHNVYSPEPSRGWKDAIALALAQHRPVFPYGGAVSVTMHFFLGEGCRLVVAPHSDPCDDATGADIDNLVKPVLDAMLPPKSGSHGRCGILLDDCQVVQLLASKNKKRGDVG